eukprot:tig00000076_g2395.t1
MPGAQSASCSADGPVCASSSSILSRGAAGSAVVPAFATSTLACLGARLQPGHYYRAITCNRISSASALAQLGLPVAKRFSRSSTFTGSPLQRTGWLARGARVTGCAVHTAPVSSSASMQPNGSQSTMRVIRVDRQSPDDALLEPAARLLREGEIVAFPTETVYGLGANALSATACAKIFTAKGRPSDNPLIVHIASLDMLSQLSRTPLSELPPRFQQTIDQFWPGPLTILFPRAASVPDIVTSGLDTVAVRFPSDPVASALIHRAGVPVAAPSANISGRPSATRAEHVVEDFEGRVQCVVDGGPCAVGLESTVLDMLRDPPLILRPGGVTLEALRAGPLPDALQYGLSPGASRDAELEAKPTTPGMKYKHYSPSAEVVLFVGRNAGGIGRRIAGEVEGLLMHQKPGGPPLGLILHSGAVAGSAAWLAQRYPNLFIVDLSTSSLPATTEDGEESGLAPAAGGTPALARDIFHALRLLDTRQCSQIFVEGTSEEGIGAAVMNRLRKAASNVIDCS